MWQALISPFTGIAKTWLEGRNRRLEAKIDAEVTVIKKRAESEADWDRIMAENSATSWKDEWLTLLFSIPMILCFFPSTVVYVEAGFVALEQMPDWYQYTLSVIVAASFGVNKAIGLMNKKGEK